jgi:hypothetical protein
MTKKQSDEEPNGENGDVTPKNPPQKSGDDTPPDGGTPKGYVTEESYQGLQRVVAKKDKELDDLKASKELLNTQLEELKTTSAASAQSKGDLEAKLKEAEDKLSSLETDRNGLNRQLKQQEIIMQEFPDLAPLAGFIPSSEDEDSFRTNAQNFKEALGNFVQKGVKKTLEGATPPQSPPSDGFADTEEERLWDTVYRTAGSLKPEDVKEYNEANTRLQEILAAKNN